jgi:hypothetical protein
VKLRIGPKPYNVRAPFVLECGCPARDCLDRFGTEAWCSICCAWVVKIPLPRTAA